MPRPGDVRDAPTAGRFDMALSEALDCISRDQEDVAGVSRPKHGPDPPIHLLK